MLHLVEMFVCARVDHCFLHLKLRLQREKGGRCLESNTTHSRLENFRCKGEIIKPEASKLGKLDSGGTATA